MLLRPGQIEVSSGYNQFVTDLDDLVFCLLSAINGMGSGVLSGLQVAWEANQLVVAPGIAVLLTGRPLLLTNLTPIVTELMSGYVVARVGGNGAEVTAVAFPEPTDVVLAWFDAAERKVVDARSWHPTVFEAAAWTLTLFPKDWVVTTGVTEIAEGQLKLLIDANNPATAYAPIPDLTRFGSLFNNPFVWCTALPILPPSAETVRVWYGFTSALVFPPAPPAKFVGFSWDGSQWLLITYDGMNLTHYPITDPQLLKIAHNGVGVYTLFTRSLNPPRWEQVARVTLSPNDERTQLALHASITSGAATVTAPFQCVVKI